MGGRDIERQERTVIYSPVSRKWRSGPDLPRPLAWGAAATVGGRLMVVGGAAGRGYSNRTFLLRQRPLA
jgi:N-acetylneuraminic acid mutarotase